jgi:tRNA U38,U39,U40 pseudouridine synthase TruA
LAAVSSYRITPQQLTTLKTALKHYVGTHFFHNFTRRCSASEMRAKRYIMEFAVADPILVIATAAAAATSAAVPVDVDGTLYEWIPTSVTGQSFLFNQIRKMISLAMDVTRGAVPLERIAQALRTKQPEVASLEPATIAAATPSGSTTTEASSSSPPQASTSTSSGNGHHNRRRIGIAPAQGLYLDMSFYTKYNERKNQTAQQAGETPPPDLDWSESSLSSSSAHERWRTFRDTVIMKHVVDEEAKEGNFLQYLYTRDFMFNDNGEE